MDFERLLNVFGKEDEERRVRLASNTRLVHYTSAENAYRIISGAKVWLRSASVMNDYSEIEHGLRCLKFGWNSEKGILLQEMLDRISEGFRQEIVDLFDENAQNFRYDTFIMSLSEHDNTEDEHGRLSMWRAYGGTSGVALVLNTAAFLSETQVMGVFSAPVRYMSDAEFVDFFSKWANRLLLAESELLAADRSMLRSCLYGMFRIFAMTTKHPGFKEEKEWRIFTSPSHEGVSNWLEYDIEVVRGTPQKVAKLKLIDDEELGVKGVHPSGLLNRVIVGPCEHPLQIRDALVDAMSKQQVTDPYNKIWMSLIPLREK